MLKKKQRPTKHGKNTSRKMPSSLQQRKHKQRKIRTREAKERKEGEAV
jgi:hypothetical protein